LIKAGTKNQRRELWNLSLIHIGRRAYRLLLGFYGLGVVFWLLKNLATGNFLSQWDYFLAGMVFHLAVGGILYIFAYRFEDRNFINLNLLFGSLILALLCTEITFRIWDHYDPIFRPEYLKDSIKFVREEERVYSPYQPGSTGMTHGNPVRINNLGFRGRDVSLQKPPGTFRILVLGDSFTMGVGIAEEETFPLVLEGQLKKRYPDRDIEVVNLGISGVGTIGEANLLSRIGPLLDPDLVLVGFVQNDLFRVDPPLRWQVPLPDSVKDFLISHSRILAWVSDRYNVILLKYGFRLTDTRQTSYDRGSKDWADFVKANERIIEWTKARGIPVPIDGLFLWSPYQSPDKSDYIHSDPEVQDLLSKIHQVGKTLDAMGIQTIDYVPYFQRHNRENFAVSKWEAHPNALSNQLFAEGFYDRIVALNVIH